MKEGMLSRFHRLFIQNLVLPLYDLTRGTSRFKFGRALEKTQWLPRREVERLQLTHLRALVKYAYETVPYYRRVFRERGLTPSDIRSTDDLVKFPILTKEDVRNNFDHLISSGFPRGELIPYRTGGSGDQVEFYVTKEQLSWEVAAEYRAYGWAGYKLGDPCFLLWGSPTDLSKYRNTLKRITTKTFERVLIADTYVMSNEVLEKFAHLLKKFHPEIVRGYASSVYMMARYLLEKGDEYVRPRAVITSAETLIDSMRETIEKAFDCPVFDFYGSREIGGMAAECNEHSGYHISAENVVMEFVGDDEHVAAGEKGVILVTGLRNFGMPFIRYKIEDVGIPSPEACSCGRGLPLLSSIEGRLSDFLAVYDKQLGRIVPVGPLYPVIAHALIHLPLRNCRVFQENIGKIVVKAVKDKGYSQRHTDFLIGCFHKFLGDDLKVEIEFEDYIPPLPSGKRSAFISRINPFEP